MTGEMRTWPPVHHLKALAAILSGDSGEAARQIRQAIDAVLDVYPDPDIRYLKDLERLKPQVPGSRDREGVAATPTDSTEVELVLVSVRTGKKSKFTGYWKLGDRKSTTRLNDLEVRVAKAFVAHLMAAIRTERDILVNRTKLENPVLEKLAGGRHEAHMRRTRRHVKRALEELLGAGILSRKAGRNGGTLFNHQPLKDACITAVKVRTE